MSGSMVRTMCGLLLPAAMTLAPAATLAQGSSSQIVPGVFHLLSGTWVGEGTLLGRAGSFRMSWDVSPAGQIRLDFTNGFVDDSGLVTPVLEAVAVYTVQPDGGVVAHWTDDRPQEISIVAEVGDSVLVSAWTAPAESGRTEYRLMDDGSLRVRDWILSGGEMRLFGEARYRRR